MTAIKRKDVHRPSVIKPEDYQFIAIIIAGEGLYAALENCAQRKMFQEHMERTGAVYSSHDHGRSCHICGAWANTYAIFHHAPSNRYINCGETCCDKLEEGHAKDFRAARTAEDARAGKRKAADSLEKMGLSTAWEIYSNKNNHLREDELALCQNRDEYNRIIKIPFEERTISDIVGKLVQYGSISEKQELFLGKLLAKIDDRARVNAERAAESEKAAPVPVSDKRLTVEGTILSAKQVEDDWGLQLKIIVQHDSGWKVYGNAPAALQEWDAETDKPVLKKGDRVQFDARLKVSSDDSKFGFFSRPTKAKSIRI